MAEDSDTQECCDSWEELADSGVSLGQMNNTCETVKLFFANVALIYLLIWLFVIKTVSLFSPQLEISLGYLSQFDTYKPTSSIQKNYILSQSWKNKEVPT